MSIEHLNKTLEYVETNVFNRAPPPFCMLSGVVRAVIGVAQLVFGGLASLFAPLINNARFTYYAHHHFMHGVFNITRATVEMLPVFHLVVLVYDPKIPRYGYLSYEDAVKPRQEVEGSATGSPCASTTQSPMDDEGQPPSEPVEGASQ